MRTRIVYGIVCRIKNRREVQNAKIETRSGHRIAIILMILFFVFAAASPAENRLPNHPVKPNILVLNSYHNGLHWSDEILRGIRDALEAMDGEPELFVEYMDTKRFLDEDYLALLFAAYRYKYRNADFDLIISSDDNAYRFLLAHKDDLFPDAPWVFCGVNHYKQGDLTGRSEVTGVVEILDRADTIDVALRLFPEARQVLVVTDRTTSGIGNREKLEALSSRFEGRADFVFLDDAETGLDLDRLVEKINAVSDPSVVYFSDFFRDAEGRFLSMETVMTTLSSETPYPIFPTSSPYLRWGPLAAAWWMGSGRAGPPANWPWRSWATPTRPISRSSKRASTLTCSTSGSFNASTFRSPSCRPAASSSIVRFRSTEPIGVWLSACPSWSSAWAS